MTDDRKDEERKTPSWQLPQERQPDSDAYHIWTPRPLLRSIYWKPVPAPPFEAVSASYEIFVDQRAWLTMHEHVWQTPAEKTPFGYLVGDLCEDPNANRRFVNITAALPARFDFHEDATEQISREATLALQLEVERRRGVLAGWYHRHLGGEVRMTEQDVRTHHQLFDDPWQCAFVFVSGGDRSEGGCFRSTPDAFAGDMQLPFYEMASNESLLARGVKRSYLDWSNYATVDEIRPEPPARPHIEIVPPPPEKPVEPEVATEPQSSPEPEPTVEDEVEEQPVDPPEPVEPEVATELEAASEPESVEEDEVEEDEVEDKEVEEDEAEEELESLAEEEESTEPTGSAVGEEVRDDIDVGALIDRVRPARIELDVYDAPVDEKHGTAAEADEASEDHVAALEEAARELDVAEAEKPERRKKGRASLVAGLGAHKGMIAAAIGGLLVITAIVAGLLSRSGDEHAGAGAGDLRSEEMTGGADGAAGSGVSGADSLAAGVTAAQIDSVGRDMLATISRFYGRAVAHDNGQATCDDLAAAYVDVENAWIRYNTEYKAEFTGPLPDELSARDTRLYAGVQDADREYVRSGCPRP